MIRGRLDIVGTGIRLSQMGCEARACIDSCDKLFVLVADHITYSWLTSEYKDAESLSTSYADDKDRMTSYLEMVERILDALRSSRQVCVVTYGHPGVFAFPMHEAVRQARKDGYNARMLPGISADACLFADLGIDPGEHGYQSFEATDFLVYGRRFDVRCTLVLWQIGIIGELGCRTGYSREGLEALVRNLKKHYDPEHLVTVYEAAASVGALAKVSTVSLRRLPDEQVNALATLLVPPAAHGEPDAAMLVELGIDRARLRAGPPVPVTT